MISKVLILRPDNLGDIVLFSGALRHIRAHYLHAKITLCVKRYVRNMLELCAYVDKLVEWENLVRPLLNPLFRLRGGTRLNFWLRHLMNQRYSSDIVLVPVRSPKCDLLGVHAIVGGIRAKEKYGISGDFSNQSPQDDRAAERFYTRRLHLSADRCREHEFYVTLDFLRFLGIEVNVDDLWPEFWTDANDHHWAERMIPKPPHSIILGVAPGVTSKEGKFYPGINIAQAISSITACDFSIFLFGSHADVPMCKVVAEAIASCKNVASITNLAGQTTLRQLGEALGRCDAVLTQETASLHLAVALHKPTVAIIGGGYYGRFYPWGDPRINRVARKPMDCYGCNWRCHYPTIRCIQEIPPDRIAEELEQVLNAAGLIN